VLEEEVGRIDGAHTLQKDAVPISEVEAQSIGGADLRDRSRVGEVVFSQVDPVTAAEIEDAVCAVPWAKNEAVSARPPGQSVSTGTASDRVIPGSADEFIVSGPAKKPVGVSTSR